MQQMFVGKPMHLYWLCTSKISFKTLILFLINLFRFYRNSKITEQESLLKLLWHLWPLLSSYGRKAAQFVDLLGYFSLRFMQSCDTAAPVRNLF